MTSTAEPNRTYNVLFLCTRNAARSVMAEAILNKDGAGRFHAYSAGTSPAGEVHPLALETLNRLGYPTEGLHTKSWEEFGKPDAPHMDFVFTVCDDAADEECPIWPGHPMTAHWGIENPALVEGSEMDKEASFNQAFRHLKNRVGVFINLPLHAIDHLALEMHLKEIGMMDGATRSQAAAG